jgi:NAD-dependent SIR2 family protein deacetylase
METIKDLVRCTNCWEGIDREQGRADDRSGECPRCGRNGQVIRGGFLVFVEEKRGNSENVN